MSRAADLKRRKHRNEILALAETPKREGTGRKKRASTRAEREPDGQALLVRARRMGKTSKEASKMRDQMLGEGAGMVLSLTCGKDTAKRLWGHYVALTSAEARCHRAMGLSIHPKCAKIEMMQERFEIRSDETPDLRTQDERDKAAKDAWQRWDGHLTSIGLGHRSAIDTAKQDFAPLVGLVTEDDGNTAAKATQAGNRFVSAMHALDAVLG